MLGILTPESMTKYDKKTIIAGTDEITLIKRAALAVIKHIPKDIKTIGIYAGTGNNGSDGIAIAYLLQNQEYNIDLINVLENRTPGGQFYFNKIDNEKVNILTQDEANVYYDCVIDCIFGNGLTRHVEGVFEKAVDKINSTAGYVISVDIPSGLSGTSGLILNKAVIADMTVAIQSLKYGHVLQDAKDVVGEIVIEDIGIVIEESDAFLIQEDDVLALFKTRKNNSNKNDYGRTTIIGGSKHFLGAPRLAEMGASALRSGCGLSTLAIPKTQTKLLANSILDTTIFPLSDRRGNIKFRKKEIEKLLKISNTLAFGMGIGRSKEIKKTLKFILENFEGPIVIDADGLYAFRDLLQGRDKVKILSKIILTPHLREFSYLTGLDQDTIKNNPCGIVKKFALENNVTVLLKGSGTIVSDGHNLLISNRGTPAQAKAGNGDVLSGVTASMLVSSANIIRSVAGASYLVGMAAELKSMELTEFSLLASDIPKAIKVIQECKL